VWPGDTLHCVSLRRGTGGNGLLLLTWPGFVNRTVVSMPASPRGATWELPVSRGSAGRVRCAVTWQTVCCSGVSHHWWIDYLERWCQFVCSVSDWGIKWRLSSHPKQNWLRMFLLLLMEWRDPVFQLNWIGLLKAYFHFGLVHYPLMPEEMTVLNLECWHLFWAN